MEITITSVLVDDQEKALKFYTEKLGFVKKHDIPVGDAKWLTVVGPKHPGGVELLLEPDWNPMVAKEVAALKAALVENGIPFTSFACEDVRREYERLSDLGVEFVQPPTDAGPVTIAVFHDTCGNLIQISHTNAAAPRTEG
jgi:catechol 2,3-dioxygenase-like lactoylglutathione lyase family enzyme